MKIKAWLQKMREAKREIRRESLQDDLGVYGKVASECKLEELKKTVLFLADHLGFEEDKTLFGTIFGLDGCGLKKKEEKEEKK